MRSGLLQKTGLSIAVISVAISVCMATPAAGQDEGKDKISAKEKHRQQVANLRRKNRNQKRPNVIVIDTDDMNASDLFIMRNTLALLGGRGTSFKNSYVSYPLCCPSRATFLTGQYAHNHGVITDQQYGQLDNSNTLAVWLKRAKYRTGMVGKYLNGYGVIYPREIPPGWTQWFGLTGGTDQKRYGFKLNENGKINYYERKAKNYIDYVLDAKVNGLIKQWAVSPKPFFLYYNPNNPHGERAVPSWSTRDPEPAPQYLGVLGDATAPRPPNFNEEDVDDKPEEIRGLPEFSSDLLADFDRRYRGRLESLLSVDDEVKKIVSLVRKYGDKRKTFFIFTSDNGLQLGAHRIQFKNYLYEEGERVPLIIRGPNLPEGVTRDQLVSNIDLAPTIIDITGATPARAVDGISLLPLVRDATNNPGRDLLFESMDVGTFGIRQGEWKYNLWTNGDEELYNIEADPYELDNLLYDPPGIEAPSPGDVALASQLRARLNQLRSCSGDTCR
jgi:N-acetylglucosamine-6-sulfatase